MDSKAGKLLFGIETEFGFTARDPHGKLYDPQTALNTLLQICASKFVHLRGSDSALRMYLANGSLLYPDVGHPEFATAESQSPLALLQSLRACEKMLADAVQCLENRAGFGAATLYRTNVDYSAIGTTWGCHESYLSRRPPAEYAARVVPHLFSRIIYTGAGGFENRVRGADFVVSPRVFHLNRTIDHDTRGHRAIFSLRDDPLSGSGYQRVHLICGESNCSDLSNYLKTGTTALVMAMAEAGVEFGVSDRWVAESTDTIRQFSRDTECRTKAVCDGVPSQSAIDIQYRYLKSAENYLSAPFMPDWAEDVCSTWRAALDGLASNPENLAGVLDWPTKLAVFKEYVRTRSDLSWQSLAVWTSVTSSISSALGDARNRWPRLVKHQIEVLRRTKGPAARQIKACTRMLREHDLEWSQLDAFQDLRDELCELDIRFGQLYPRGIFLDLEDAGEIDGRMLQPSQIDEAIERAPEAGRARIRGDWIRHLAPQGDKYACQWTGIRSETDYLDLQDPFVTSAEWVETLSRRHAPREESRNFSFTFPDHSFETAEAGEETVE